MSFSSKFFFLVSLQLKFFSKNMQDFKWISPCLVQLVCIDMFSLAQAPQEPPAGTSSRHKPRWSEWTNEHACCLIKKFLTRWVGRYNHIRINYDDFTKSQEIVLFYDPLKNLFYAWPNEGKISENKKKTNQSREEKGWGMYYFYISNLPYYQRQTPPNKFLPQRGFSDLFVSPKNLKNYFLLISHRRFSMGLVKKQGFFIQPFFFNH